jgi:hypothetical protein
MFLFLGYERGVSTGLPCHLGCCFFFELQGGALAHLTAWGLLLSCLTAGGCIDCSCFLRQSLYYPFLSFLLSESKMWDSQGGGGRASALQAKVSGCGA